MSDELKRARVTITVEVEGQPIQTLILPQCVAVDVSQTQTALDDEIKPGHFETRIRREHPPDQVTVTLKPDWRAEPWLIVEAAEPEGSERR